MILKMKICSKTSTTQIRDKYKPEKEEKTGRRSKAKRYKKYKKFQFLF